MSEPNWYPTTLRVSPKGTAATYEFMKQTFAPQQHIHYAEFGIYQGATAEEVAKSFFNSILHLFDFHEAIANVKQRLYYYAGRIIYYGNTQKFNDSYNWALMKLVEAQKNRYLFDYCFLDGAHTLAVDGLTFFLCDKLLKPGGYMDFDDYGWRLRGSSLDPAKIPIILDQYTEEQIDAFQIKMIIDNLVRPDSRYKEIIANKIFQKIRN